MAASSGCRGRVQTLPDVPPSLTGRVTQRSFATDSSGSGNLYLFGVSRTHGSQSSLGVTEGYFRVDSLTRWVVARGDHLEWSTPGVPALYRATVRVWLRGAPTSLTAKEVWGRAELVVIDSLGK